MPNSLKNPVSFGVTGLGGYAGFICRTLLDESSLENPSVRLEAVCEPDLEAHSQKAQEFRNLGIKVVRDHHQLFALPIEAVWLPLPIPLHRPYTELALQSGVAVMCEKPAAGCVQDLDAMCAARDASGLPVAIGFQDIYRSSTSIMKQALLSGRIGSVRSATLTACWPRDSRYYGRSAWAGRMMQDGVWVMDSPANNALAHFLNLALFLLGDSSGSASLARVEAELYRVNPIENYDTCALRYTTTTGATLLVYFTHASRDEHQPELVIHGDAGNIVYSTGKEVVITMGENTETISLVSEGHGEMVRRFANLVRGVEDQRPVATLEIARTHLVAVNGASEASAVQTILPRFVESIPRPEGAHLLTIKGIEDLFDHCSRAEILPSESGSAEWSSSGGMLSLLDYKFFNGPKIQG